MSEAPPETAPPPRRTRLLFYHGPLAGWILLLAAASTGLGDYGVSLRLIHGLISFLNPRPQSLNIHALYQVNVAARSLAQIAAFLVLAALALRAFQAGAAEWKPRAAWGAGAFSLAAACLAAGLRGLIPRRHGGVNDLLLNAAGVALALGLARLFFAVKAWERRAAGR